MGVEKKLEKTIEKKTKKRKKLSTPTIIEPNGHSVTPVEPETRTRNFPLISELELPTREAILSLDGEGQRKAFAKLGDVCERLVRLIDDTQVITTKFRNDNNSTERRDPHAVEDALIADMAKLKGLPTARRFSEQSLRKRMKRFTNDTVHYIDSITPSGMRDEVKQKQLDLLTTNYSDELNAIREKEQLNVSGVQTLLKCLDETAELASSNTKNV